jgi:hypothetical protein
LERVPVALLAETPMIGFSPEKMPGPFKIAKKLELEAGVHFHSTLEVDGLIEAARAVERGFGFAFITDHFEPISGIVKKQLALDTLVRMDMVVVHRHDNPLPALALFLSLLHESNDCQ